MSGSRVAVVTGGTQGIGAAVASLLVKDDFAVASLDVIGCADESVMNVQCDVSRQEDVEAAFGAVERTLGAPSVVVANAGINRDGLALQLSDEDFFRVMEVNLGGAFRIVRRSLPAMVKARYGRIVLIGSIAAMHGAAGQANYAASKAGLIGFARSIAREVGSRGITCNVVAPGLIDTPMTSALEPKLKAKYIEQIPLGRVGQPEEVAAAVKFLVSDGADYINGVVLPVDGGLGMGF